MSLQREVRGVGVQCMPPFGIPDDYRISPKQCYHPQAQNLSTLNPKPELDFKPIGTDTRNMQIAVTEA